jgi:hypothetical protein
LNGDEKSDSAFHQLKKVLIAAPVLGLPVQDKFQLYVYEKGVLVLGGVTQLQGITPQAVGYLIKKFRLGHQGMAWMSLSSCCS